MVQWDVPTHLHAFTYERVITGGTNQGPAYYQECVSLFGKKVFMKPVNE